MNIYEQLIKWRLFAISLLFMITVPLFAPAAEYASPQDTWGQIQVQVSDEDRSAIEKHIRRLGSKEGEERADAINQLVRYDRRALPNVLDALRNHDPLVRYGAVDVLVRMSYLDDTKRILEAFSEEKSHNVIIRYINLFSNVGINDPQVRDALIKTLKEEKDEKVRAEIAMALVRFSGEEAETAMMDALLGSETEFVKIYLVKALGERRSERAVPIYESLLSPDEIGVGPLQLMAVQSLRQIGTKEAVRILINCFDHPRREIPAEACLALASLKKNSLGDLITALKDNTKSKLIRGGAAEALGMMENQAALHPLQDASKNDPDPYVRWKAGEALGKLMNSPEQKMIEI